MRGPSAGVLNTDIFKSCPDGYCKTRHRRLFRKPNTNRMFQCWRNMLASRCKSYQPQLNF